jgi:hypothetical protein
MNLKDLKEQMETNVSILKDWKTNQNRTDKSRSEVLQELKDGISM